MQKAIASVDSGGVGRAKRASIFTALAMAFCLLFATPQKAEASEITDWSELFKAIMELGGGEFVSYLTQYEGVQIALTTGFELYADYKELAVMAKEFELFAREVRDYYKAYYKAKAIEYLIDTLNKLNNAIDLIDNLNKIADAIDEIKELARTYKDSLEAGQEVLDKLEDIKAQLDDFVETVTEIANTANAVIKIVDALNNFTNVGNLVKNLKDNSFLKKAAKDISNKQPNNIIPDFDFDTAGLSTSVDDLVVAIDDMVCIFNSDAPECFPLSPEWCAARKNNEDACVYGHPSYCNMTSFHQHEQICIEGTAEFCGNVNFNFGHPSCQ
jgi:hypothetical protein